MLSWVDLLPAAVAFALSLALRLYVTRAPLPKVAPLADRRRRLLAAAFASLIGLNALTTFAYIAWRVVATAPSGSPLLDVPWAVFLLAELYGAFQLAVFLATVAGSALSPPAPRRPQVAEASLPSVEVFITCVDEPLEVVARTVAAAVSLDYPAAKLRVAILDDGGRDDLARLAAAHRCRHLVRPDRPRAAKAGNLNWGLRHTDAELVVTLDADMVPKPTFLTETVPYFAEPDVGFVQTPQTFYNTDKFQEALSTDLGSPLGEQSFFMRELLSGKQAFDAVMYVGSNAVFRVAALRHVGGFAEGVITEDVPTGMLLEAAGYRGVFVDRVLAMGLAPETVPDLVRQRIRWCEGNIRAALRWNPLTLPGLTAAQRLQYLSGSLYWFFGVANLVLFGAPVAYLALGVRSLAATLPSVLWWWLPPFVVSLVTFDLFANGRTTLYRQRMIEYALTPHIARAALHALLSRRPLRFEVTPKGVRRGPGERLRPITRWPLAYPHLALLALAVYAVVHVLLVPGLGHLVGNGAYDLNLFWVLFNAVTLASAVRLFVERPDGRFSPRAEVALGAEVALAAPAADTAPLWRAEILDASETGACLHVPCAPGGLAYPIGQRLFLAIDGLPAPLPAEVRWSVPTPDGWRLGVRFEDTDAPTFRALVRLAYGRLIPESERPRGARAPHPVAVGTDSAVAEAQRVAARTPAERRIRP